ncbi:MAG TPA: protein translocase subunit SecF [Actinospica sp.]|nr:protein translocase subunit SecF [Actinospica sp.]
MSRLENFSTLGNRLYSGETAVEVVGRRKRWFASFGIVLLLAALGLGVRGLHFSVDFTGGTVLTVPSQSLSTTEATSIAVNNGVSAPVVQQLTVTTGGAGHEVTVTTPVIELATENALKADLAKAAGINVDSITVQTVGASWGHEVSKDALEALAVFLVLVAIYLAVFFEWQMAAAALVSLLNVIVITVGVYAWSGLEVSPATVTGFLTILGYAIYDAVVVFDKIRENRKQFVDTDRLSYNRAANLAVNQTLMRSLNTSLIAVIPVVALMIGGVLSEAAVLQDIALALFVGIAAGTVSSILLAAPLLVWIKERNPAVRAHTARMDNKAKKEASRAGAAEEAQVEQAVSVGAPEPGSVGAGTIKITGRVPGPQPAQREVQPRGNQRPQPRSNKKKR